ncbi:hypothetical protein [Streptomyces sp. NPDC020951]|uniref:hypothetical protein n=1 Tax=Streptomyces sp. NPDC020951 TaxID=3365104 RepID=UPI0037A425D9
MRERGPRGGPVRRFGTRPAYGTVQPGGGTVGVPNVVGRHGAIEVRGDLRRLPSSTIPRPLGRTTPVRSM